MNITALFAGVGGLELGLRAAGGETLLTCEIWPPAAQILREKYGAPHHDDVADLSAIPQDTDLLTAGFPCQDLSQAGRTAGIGGRKSGLVDHVFRLIDGSRVPLVVLENVSFMLSLDRGAAMQRLTDAFEARGFRWAYRTVNSLAFLPQRRARVFFVASRGDLAPEDVLFADEAEPQARETTLTSHAHGFYWTEGTRGLGWAPDAVPTLKNGSAIGIPSPPAIVMPGGAVITPDIRDAERLQGFPEDWTASAPPRLRWSLVGNAVTVPVAAWLGARLAAPGRHDPARDRPFAPLRGFPPAARFDGAQRFTVEIGAFPVWRGRAPLHRFLRHEGAPLSPRATAGFLSRAEKSSLRFAPGFLDALRDHLDRMRASGAREQRPRLQAEA